MAVAVASIAFAVAGFLFYLLRRRRMSSGPSPRNSRNPTIEPFATEGGQPLMQEHPVTTGVISEKRGEKGQIVMSYRNTADEPPSAGPSGSSTPRDFTQTEPHAAPSTVSATTFSSPSRVTSPLSPRTALQAVQTERSSSPQPSTYARREGQLQGSDVERIADIIVRRIGSSARLPEAPPEYEAHVADQNI